MSSRTDSIGWVKTGRRTERGACAVVGLIPHLDVWRPGGYAGKRRRLGRGACAGATAQCTGAVATGGARGGAAGRHGGVDRPPGGYVLADAPGARAVIIGTELNCTWRCRRRRCWPPRACRCGWCRCQARRSFDRQDAAYVDAVLPPDLPAVRWRRRTPTSGAIVGRRARWWASRFRRIGAAPGAVPALRITERGGAAAVRGLLGRDTGAMTLRRWSGT